MLKQRAICDIFLTETAAGSYSEVSVPGKPVPEQLNGENQRPFPKNPVFRQFMLYSKRTGIRPFT
jgi:hypothetical protein